MVCKVCRNNVKDDWKNCPICGNVLSDNGNGNIEERTDIPGLGQQESFSTTGLSEPYDKKKRKLPWIFGGALAVVIIACIGILIFGSEDTETYSEALALVQNGTYRDYTDVLLKDVLEYNWKDGIWDSFEGENDNGDTLLIVEYAKDKSRDTMVQFSVKLEKESFGMVHLKIDGKAFLDEEADEKIEKMYLAYFAEKYPLDDIDLADYAGGEYAALAKASNAFSITDKEMLLCEDVSRQIMIDLTDDKLIQLIVIEGDGTYTPEFAGNKTGMKLEDVDKRTLEEKGYTKVFLENEFYSVYGNPGNKSVVGFNAEENGIVSRISWETDMYDAYLEETEEEEYIFPDSDKRYLTEDEVRSIPEDKLIYARNEIFARHGRQFDMPELAEYFSGKSWYNGTVPSAAFSNSVFNDFELKNIELIKRIEDGAVGTVQFIGRTGTYISTNPWDYTGRIEIVSVNAGSITFTLGALEYMPDVISGEAQIIDSNTAQMSNYGFTITFRWTDSGNMTVTHSGEITGMDAGIIFDVTDNQNYTWAAEFNTGGGTG